MPVAQQVIPNTKPATTQFTFRQLIGQVLQWNPDVPPSQAQAWINAAYRKVVDRRKWYGLMVRGRVSVPQVYTTGNATMVSGSAVVNGTGTVWTSQMVGRQIRAGFTSGFYDIASVQGPTQLTLDLPWGDQSLTNAGYQILQNLVSLGNNIKLVLEAVNQRQGYRLFVNWPQAVLNRYDTWRVTTGWTFALANREPSADGQPQFELYPAPTFQQSFPYIAYVQPPDMTLDGDFPYLFIRGDVIMLDAIAEALVFRGPKLNPRYDADESQRKRMQFDSEVMQMMRNDDDLYLKDLQWDYGAWPYSQHGSLWLQSHAGDIGL